MQQFSLKEQILKILFGRMAKRFAEVFPVQLVKPSNLA